MDYNPSIIDKDGIPDFTIIGIGSNKELFELIIKYKACNNEYQRHFTINKIFK